MTVTRLAVMMTVESKGRMCTCCESDGAALQYPDGQCVPIHFYRMYTSVEQ
jgi:hypothetical protein